MLSASVSSADQLPKHENLKALSLSALENQLKSVNAELDTLAHYSLRSGIGAIGFRSNWHESAEQTAWIEVELEKEFPIDEIILVPTIWRDTNKGFKGDSFPVEFRILAGTGSDRDFSLVASYSATDGILPRIAPLVVPTSGTTASRIRIEATRLSPRAFDSKFVFQLAEILVFSGQENVALRRPVQTSSISTDNAGAWDRPFLVDGFMPYLMDSAQGSQSVAYVSSIGQQPSLSFDLGSEYPISRIHLHAVDQSDTVPQAYAGDLGIPRHLIIEGANRPDFSDAIPLLDYHRNTINDTGPIMMWNIPETTCRFVRLVAEQSGSTLDRTSSKFRIGFSEIELFSKGRNVALGILARADPKPEKVYRSLSALTDGNNLYGKILPIRDWLEELARRHELESNRPILAAELSRRYAQQKTNLKLVSWLAALLGVGICVTFLIDRHVHMRQATEMKERFAADLHDELGANLHTIGLLSDLAKDSIDSRDELLELLDQIRVFTERSGTAARNCTNILEAKGICEDLVEAMNRTSTRLLADLEYEIAYQGEDGFMNLKPRKRIDLFFFYKECLTNIIRHSGATKVSTQMIANGKTIDLTVTDNGKGLSTSVNGNRIPPSLTRRARLLGAQVTALPIIKGTRIHLKLKTKRFGVI
jgi:signal transduction histidine kinase